MKLTTVDVNKIKLFSSEFLTQINPNEMHQDSKHQKRLDKLKNTLQVIKEKISIRDTEEIVTEYSFVDTSTVGAVEIKLDYDSEESRSEEIKKQNDFSYEHKYMKHTNSKTSFLEIGCMIFSDESGLYKLSLAEEYKRVKDDKEDYSLNVTIFSSEEADLYIFEGEKTIFKSDGSSTTIPTREVHKKSELEKLYPGPKEIYTNLQVYRDLIGNNSAPIQAQENQKHESILQIFYNRISQLLGSFVNWVISKFWPAKPVDPAVPQPKKQSIDDPDNTPPVSKSKGEPDLGSAI